MLIIAVTIISTLSSLMTMIAVTISFNPTIIITISHHLYFLNNNNTNFLIIISPPPPLLLFTKSAQNCQFSGDRVCDIKLSYLLHINNNKNALLMQRNTASQSLGGSVC